MAKRSTPEVDDDFNDPNPDADTSEKVPMVRAVALPDSRTLRDMTPGEILAALGDIGDASEVVETDQFGPILDDKDKLVAVPFIVIDWEFHKGDFGEFVTVKVMTFAGDKFLLNDGSTGIAAQLRETYDEKGAVVPFRCMKGLRRSDYEKVVDGKTIPASTYYIDTAL